MNVSATERIEREFSQLTLPDQLRLLDRLTQRIRKATTQPQPSLEEQLTAMAGDPFMQRELRAIEAEFSALETDGLTED